MWLLRHAFAIAVLPFTVSVVVPAWIVNRDGLHLALGAGPMSISAQLLGLAIGIVGFALFVSTVRRFAGEGRGTLAPWDPPRRLVVEGAYRYVRNPMISGVACVLIAEALVLRSKAIGWWALIFVAINAVYIPLLEEPMLAARFGDDYREYCRHVPRIIPRLTPYTGRRSAEDEQGA